MPIKFSQFTNRTSTTAGTTIVGFDGNQNIKILSSDLVSGFINGTAHTLPVFTTANTLGDSIVAQDASATQLHITGDVGIGTTAPGGKLEVNGGTGVATSGGTLIVRQDGDTSNDGIALTSSNSISHRIYKNAGGTFLMGPSTDSDAFALDLNGNVGIGTTAPSQKLEVGGNVLLQNNDEIRFKDSGGTERTAIELDPSNNFNIGTSAGGNLIFINGSSYTERMRITSAGDVGIGTDSPGSKLTVRSSGLGTTPFKIEDSGGALLMQLNEDGVGNAEVRLNNSSGTQTVRLDTSGSSYFTGGNFGIGTTSPQRELHVHASNFTDIQLTNDTTGSTASDGSTISATNSDLYINNKESGNLLLYTNSSEKMRVTSAGNVGIGTAAPDGLLHVSAGDSGDAVVIIEADADNTGSENDNPHLELRQDGATIKAKLGIEGEAGNTYSNSVANATYLGTVFEQPVQFITGDTGSVQTAKMTILANTGNVGIGHTSPSSILHIKQDTTGTGNLTGLTIEQDGTGDAIAHFLLTGARRWVLGADNSDADKFKLASTSDLDSDAAITVTTTGFVGIGTTNPTSRLHVSDGSIHTRLNYISGSDTYLAYVEADSGSVDTSIYIARSGSGGQQAAIEFEEDSTGTYRDNEMRFKLTQPQTYNVLEYMRFQYSTAVTSLVNIQAYKPIVAMEGVYIGGSSNQNSAPHYLDDYEEGSFTPTFYGTSGLAITYDTQVGRYVKVGRVVHAFIELGSDAVTYASGSLEIHGLPFAADDLDGAAHPGLNYSFQTSLADYTFVISENNSKINIYLRNGTSQYPANQLGTGTNANRLRLVATYITTT